MGNSLSNTNSPFSLNEFYSQLFSGITAINVAVVRANASNGLGRVFQHQPRTFPAITVSLANFNAYDSLLTASNAIRSLNNNLRSVIMISGDITIIDQTINLPNATIVTGYYDYSTSPNTGFIIGNRSLIRFNGIGPGVTTALVNMNIRGNISITNNVNTGVGIANNDFTIAASNLDLTTPILLNIGNRTNVYILSSTVNGPNPLFNAIKEGVNNGNIYFVFSNLYPVSADESALVRPTFARGAAARININFISTQYLGNRVATNFFLARLVEDIPENGNQNIGVDAYWYNNIIQSSDDYLSKPMDKDEHANNYLVNAVLIEGTIDTDKFVKYRYMNKEADVITNSEQK